VSISKAPKALVQVLPEGLRCRECGSKALSTNKVLLAAVLIDALHAALENAEISFDAVRRDVAARALFGSVINTLVRTNLKALIEMALVRHQAGFA